MNTTDLEYTAQEVCRISHASYRQIDYWCHLGVLQPRYGISGYASVSSAEGGSGTRRLFSQREALKATAIVQMLADGLTFEAASRLARDGKWAKVAIHPLPTVTDEHNAPGDRETVMNGFDEYLGPDRLPNGRKASRRTGKATPAPHGTRARYDQGCTCKPCTSEAIRYTKAMAAERKAGRSPSRTRTPRNSHATSTTLDDLLKEW